VIISASRRTDIPAYFSDWFIKRIEEGFCTVPNPFNSNQISFVDLRLQAVTAIVFWTRNPKPLIKNLSLLDKKGYKYYFQFTINNYPRLYEKHNPGLETTVNVFQKLSERLGKGKVIWRYDPILFTDDLTIDFHISNFNNLFAELGDYTKRIVISIVDNYKKTQRRVTNLQTNYDEEQIDKPEVEKLLAYIVGLAKTKNIEVESCAEAKNFGYLGIEHGRCIDDKLLKREFSIDLTYKKDKGQRLPCGCMISRDIGMNDTCFMGCEYCYATNSHNKAVENKKKHDVSFSSLLVHEMPDEVLQKIYEFKNKPQLNLWEG
jgi:hypothetical protein